MKITGEKGLGNILKIFLQICLCVGIIITIILPFLLHKIYVLNLINCIIIIYPNGIILSVITYKFIQLFNSLKNNNPFCESTVKILKFTGIIAFIGSIFWLADLIYELIAVRTDYIVFIVTLIFLCVLFLGVSIALYILSELFKKAIEYKEENELTI